MVRQANDDWNRVKALFDDALRRPAGERSAFVRAACGDNSSLLSDVESLLESLDSAESFLETPAVVEVAENIFGDENRLARGDMLLHYEIRDLLGSGGMGEVYLARDTRLERNVAIKVLRASFLPDDHANRRLLREARAAALLEHPNICQIHEISEADGHSFIVMQYVVGPTLADILASRGGLGPVASLDLVTQIVEGLAEAHSQGIIHRDIKPSNVIVTDKDRAKILDFGLAKFIDADTNSETQRLHTSGAVMGTVPFMSPEQLRGKTVDARTDIFSVGALLYEMLAGKPAFNRDNNAETIASILNEEPDWSAIPHSLRPVLRKCMAKAVDERFSSAEELLGELRNCRREILHDGPTAETDHRTTGEARGAKRRQFYFWQSADEVGMRTPADSTQSPDPRRHRSIEILAVTAGVMVLVVGIGLGVWYWLQPAQPNFDSLRPVRIVSWKSGAETNATDFRISHDGKMIAYSSSQHGGAEEIYIKQTSDGKELQVTRDHSTNVSPLWSPDDQRIAFVSNRHGRPGIYASPTLGGAVSLLRATNDQTSISLRSWSRDGSSIFYDERGNLYRLDLRTGEVFKLTDLPEVKGITDRFFAVSPDEKLIAFTNTTEGQKDIWTTRVDGGEPTRITNDSQAERRLVWHPDGDRLLYNVSRNDFIQINIVAADGKGQPAPVTRGEGKYSLIDVSPEGDRIFYSTTEPRSDISSVDVLTGYEEGVATEPAAELWSDVSPDGNAIVYHSNASPNPSGRISRSSVLIRSAGGETKALPNGGFDARWLPDGRHISLFRASETRQNDYDAWIIDTLTGHERLMTAERVMRPSYSVMPITRTDIGVLDFSPDGKRVVYLDMGKPQNVKRCDIQSGSVESLTRNENANVRYSSPKFSPDGTKIVMVSVERQDEARAPVSRVLLADGEASRGLFSTTDGLRLLGWSAKGEVVVATAKGIIAGSPGDIDIVGVSLDGTRRNITTLRSTYGHTLTLSRDGKSVAFTVNRDDRDNIWMISLTPMSSPQQITANGTTRQFLTNLVFSPDGKRIYFDKQEEINTISMFENLN